MNPPPLLMKYRLRDCQKMAEAHQSYYRSVPGEVLDSVKPGGKVRLIFDDPKGMIPPESLWVKVLLRSGDLMRGEIMHRPFAIGVKEGDIVSFETRHIAAVEY